MGAKTGVTSILEASGPWFNQERWFFGCSDCHLDWHTPIMAEYSGQRRSNRAHKEHSALQVRTGPDKYQYSYHFAYFSFA